MISTHNYIPYNCDLMLMLIKHYLLISTSHQLKSFISTNQAHNTWMIFLQISQPGTDFNSPGTQQWAVHGQPTSSTPISLFGTEFLTHFRSYEHQSIIYSINYHKTPQFSPQNRGSGLSTGSPLILHRFQIFETDFHSYSRSKAYQHRI